MNQDQHLIDKEESLDPLNLPPRSEVHQKTSKSEKGVTKNPLFIHKFIIHTLLILFILLIIGIPLYYLSFIPS
ncbi:hypothetical protein [Alkalibacillus aidingensis]|uniref:hypothetical protein n=1 Tax=Alkalibacillus aidingensis TaxID=2747607 RepID=UPI0016611EFE|nr:hypothetical protein [Alkalibacillus aidingensis]